MTVSIARTDEEIQHMPLVELAFLLLRTKQEPMYFRELMAEIQTMRKWSDKDVTGVIAHLYTEINIDGRFICTGQNVWGLKRWYPTDKPTDRPTSRRFVRSTGDAFSDDDEDLDDYDETADDDSSDFETPKKVSGKATAEGEDESDSLHELDDGDSEEEFSDSTDDEEDDDVEGAVAFDEDEEETPAVEEESDGEDDEEHY